VEARNAATSKRRGFVVWVRWCAHTQDGERNFTRHAATEYVQPTGE
jgi:hypothetical protein